MLIKQVGEIVELNCGARCTVRWRAVGNKAMNIPTVKQSLTSVPADRLSAYCQKSRCHKCSLPSPSHFSHNFTSTQFTFRTQHLKSFCHSSATLPLQQIHAAQFYNTYLKFSSIYSLLDITKVLKVLEQIANIQLNLQLPTLRAVRQVTTHTHTHTYTHTHIPATALQLDTIINKHVVNLLHVSSFFIRLQGGS
jgi:hypothetical protein